MGLPGLGKSTLCDFLEEMIPNSEVICFDQREKKLKEDAQK